MAIMEDFGVIIACYEADYIFAKACCASIKHFLGNVPICLIVDGNFSLRSLEKTYGVRKLERQSISNDFLRKKSFGWGITKMIAFWESPWKNFLFLDADTNVWGNVLKYANFQDFDLVIDRPNYEYKDKSISKYFFDIQAIEKYFPNFNWQAHRSDYFCTGAFFAKRDVFNLDEYRELVKFNAKHPGIFKYGEMGILNLMIFRAADEGRIRLKQEDMQLVVPEFQREELRKRFSIDRNGPVCRDETATVIHWCGPKPMSFSNKIYPEPMNFYRRKFLYDARKVTGMMAEAVLKIEDFQRYYYIYKNKFRHKIIDKLIEKFHQA